MVAKIVGTGSYIPENIIVNSKFRSCSFYDPLGQSMIEKPDTIIGKFESITGIRERKYVGNNQKLSDIAAVAASRALGDCGMNAESLDVIILAHNFGDIAYGTTQADILPSIATRVKQALNISNPDCVAFDIVFGCPGWVQAMILARQYIQAGNAQRLLVIGGETLSRVIDPYDRDSMIYADGAAATVVEARSAEIGPGIVSTCSQTYAQKEAYYLHYDISNNKSDKSGTRYLKMHGKKIYEFALKHVPAAMKRCLDESGIPIHNLKKIFIHQANAKMDQAILNRFYELYGIGSPPENVMPMNIHYYGNSSVATIPTLLDEVLKNKYPQHQLQTGDAILLASVGAGMNVNAITYII
jgi:3-oxoacyl-[acyl-carrier-protein] synthase III